MTAAITDADRELFIDLFTPGWKHPESSHRWEVTSGGMDDDPRMQALAAHRIQARKEAIEEAARVAREFANEAALTIEGKALTNAVMAVRGNVAAAVHIAEAIRALGEGVE